MLVLAAITDRLVDFATNVVGDLGLAGIYVLMFLESACIPIPSEATMLFAGFNVSDGRFTLLEITLVGTVANVMGSWLAYAVGYYGRVDLIEKHGNKLHVSPKHLATADRWFERHGEATVFFARMLPDHPHLHLAARGCGQDAVLALHLVHHAGLPALGVRARVHRPAGGRQLGGLEGQAALPRLRGRSRRSSLGSPTSSSATAAAGARPSRPRMPPAASSTELELRHALALGVLQGPAELLPVSSSGHITLVPWLLRWPYPDLDPELRKSFEVALHAGTALALLIGLRAEVGTAIRDFDGRRAALIALSFAPPAFVGYTWERPIERRLGTPGDDRRRPADRVGVRWCGPTAGRSGASARTPGVVDALCLGLAQACALMPGISRNGATLAAARARGFTREDANVLSRHVALPIIVGAAALKGHRLWRRGLPPGGVRAIATGAGAAFASTLASIKLIALVERDSALAPYAAYRTALAVLVIRRVRQNGRT